MLFLKTVALIVAGVWILFALSRMMGELKTVKVQAKPDPRRPVRLRQDPRTGVYHPEE